MPEGGGRTEQILTATLPIVPILAPLGIHFLLVNFTLLDGWLPDAYFLSHLVVFMVGIWCAHEIKSIIAVICLIVVVAITMLLDIIALGIYYVDTNNSTREFSYAMCIINLILKPLTIALCSLALYVRAGGRIGSLGGGGGGGGGTAEGYNDIHGSNEGQ